MKRLGLASCLLCMLMAAIPALAEAPLTPGFTTLGIWEPEQRLRLDVALWYPTRRPVSEVKYDDWVFQAARGARAVEGRHPLILLSHDSAGSRFSLHRLAAALARSGFVVAAPTHAGDNLDDMRLIFTPEQLFNRAEQLRGLLNALLRLPETEPLIDSNRVGVLGVGPGGAAALLLGGARLDRNGWEGYCQRTIAEDSYCSAWARPLMTRFAARPGLGTSLRDARIRAVAAVAPGFGMFFTREGLASMRTPVLLLRADLDATNLAPNHAEGIRGRLPAPPVYDVLRETDAASLMSPCAPTLTPNLPEMCAAATAERRERTQTQLASLTARFFVAELGKPGLPPAPAETSPGELHPLPDPAAHKPPPSPPPAKPRPQQRRAPRS